MGCVTVTYDAPLKKYLMCGTDGGNTCSRMSTYILEADQEIQLLTPAARKKWGSGNK